MSKLKILGTFGDIQEVEADIGDSRVHGYILPSGAWSLYPDKDGPNIPCEWIALRFKRKRKYVSYRKDFIIEGLPK